MKLIVTPFLESKSELLNFFLIIVFICNKEYFNNLRQRRAVANNILAIFIGKN
nr:MAG TPA: hypothetical protein [Caudoviricetes sp.]